ncbi:MAG TPA: hypothetical protein VFV49_15205 [Thermoanaerobaculia bacterium]|nr:hypothetical protein [Thermoanaerobaculia bacterium]
MLNIAGPEYDFGSVVFVVLEECEHRRRGFDDDEAEEGLMRIARNKLAKIKQAYDEFGGAPAYWKVLETEVLETAMPQYIAGAREMTALERSNFGIWRGGDPVARFAFALSGLGIGTLLLVFPFLKLVEAMLALALAFLGGIYPEIKRYTHERRHFRLLNRLVVDATRYQENAKLHYMTSSEIRESFAIEGTTTSAERERE